MGSQITPIDTTKFQITDTPLPQTTITVYDINDLKQMMANSQALQAEQNAARVGEQATIQALIDQAASVGIKPAPAIQVQPASLG